MVGDHDGPISIFLALRHIRKDRSQQISRARALHLKRNFFAVPVEQKRQRAIGVPSPPRLQQRGEQRGLLQDFLYRILMQEVENIGERKAVLLSQRNVYAVVCSCSLQLKVERHTETLA